MSASSARAALFDVLRAALPDPVDPDLDGVVDDVLDLGVDVLKYARDIDPPARVTVMLRHDEVARDPIAPLARRRYTFAVLVVPSSRTPGIVDDELESALELVLDAIEQEPSCPQWTAARRVLFGATEVPAYEVELPFTATIQRGT